MFNLDWSLLERKQKTLLNKLTNSNIDQKERANIQKLSSQYSTALEMHNHFLSLQSEIKELKEQKNNETNPELLNLFEEEINTKTKELNDIKNKLEDILYPSDIENEKSVFLELRAGAGGQEAALFVSDLFKMYSNYALSKGWQVSIVDSNSTEIGGFKELIIHIKGKNVYKYLKFESGVHRVQRVPETETSGRIHTSTITVAVLPEAEDVDVQINPQDIRIDTFRASGAGGQHVNTTDSAVRITHLPTGIVVSCQDERSQIKNKNKALKILKSRILKAEKERKESELQATRKEQVGMGERAEKIRTYNYPQNRITDHRINLTLKKLNIIMQGNLDEIIIPLIKWEKSNKKKTVSIFSKFELAK